MLNSKQQISSPKVKWQKPPLKSTFRIGKPEGIKKIIAIHSGKGGVGKTFVAVNLAVFLAKKNNKVGLLDADIDCPNVMKVLQLEGKLIADKNKKIVPLQKFGVEVVSMASLLTSEDQALMWRGVIVSRAVEQFIHDTAWGELDFLIIDLPPGTGDIPLTIFQILKEAELIVVTTPQQLALVDAGKSINTANKMGIKILGILENMSGDIFGKGSARKLAKKYEIPFLGSIKLAKKYSETSKKPSVIFDKNLQKIFAKIIKS